MKVNKVKHAIIAAFAAVFAFVAPAVAANVAKIGDTEYATLDAAIDAWKEGDEIKLLCNIDRADYFFITKNFVIDGCGYTLKCTKAHDGYNYFVNNNGYKQTFKNITIDGNKQVAYAAQCINTSSTLILDNVTLKGGKTTLLQGLMGYGLHINKGNVIANDLKVSNCDATAVYIDSNKAAGGSFTLTGDNCDLDAVGVAEGTTPTLSITAKGFSVYDVSAKYSYSIIFGTREGTKNLSNVISALSWNQAISEIQSKISGLSVKVKSATVTLKGDVKFKEDFTSNESRLTVDGAGKTVTGKFIFNSSTPSTVKNIVLGNGSVLDCTASMNTGFSGVSVAANTTIDILLPASTDMNSYALPVALATDAVANIFVGDKKYIAKNGVIAPVEKVAQIGDKQYATLQEAIDAANGAVIQVLKDVALTSSITVPAGKTLTLNLAGRKVTISGADYALVNNGNLTIVDMGLVTVVAAEAMIGDETAAPILIMAPSANDGVAVIDDATGGSIAGVQNKGTFALESGSVVSASASVPAIDNTANAAAIITGGTVEGKLQSTDKTALTITGGSFIGESNVSEFVGGDFGVDSNGTIVKNVAKIGEVGYLTLEAALAAAQDGQTVELLWAEGYAPIAMNGSVYGKSVTITGSATVDWSKGFLFVGRGGEGNGTVIFDNANLESASNNASYGIHVSGREKNTNNKYDGTVVVSNSTIVLDYLIDKGAMAMVNSTLTVKNGFAVGGRPAHETESGADATATFDLTNGSTLIVNNHNGMGLGYEAIGVMNIDGTSTFECNQSFLVTDKGVLKSAGNILGDIVKRENAQIELTGGIYTDEEVQEWCADGYAALPNLDNQYVVGVEPTATVNNFGMTTVPAGEYGVWNGSSYTGTSTVDMPLSFVMQFLADQDEEDMATSPFADWYGDFVITFTGIENGSFKADGCYLAGYYGDFGWVKIPVDGMSIENGVRYPVMLGVGLGQKYDYICSGVQDFKCAMFLTPEILAVNPNLKVNLELAVVDNSKGEDAAASALVNNENIMSIVDYTYDTEDFVINYVAQIGERKFTSFAEALAAAQEGDTVELLSDASVEGTAQIPAGVTIKSNGYKILGSIRMLGDLTLDGALEITGGLWVGKAGETLAATLAGDKLTAFYFMFQYGSYTIDADIDAVYGYLSFEGEFEVNSTITTSNTNGEPLWLRGQINLNEGASFIAEYLHLDNANTVLNVKKGASITAGSGVSLKTAGAQLYSSGDISGSISAIDGTTVSLTGGTYTQDVAEYCAEGYNSVKQPDKEQWQVGKLPNAEVINVGPYTVDEESYYIYNITNKSFSSGHKDEFDLQVTLGFIANDTLEEAAANAYGEYLTDFRIKIEGIENGSFVADKDCYLAGYYPFFGGWVKVNLDGMTIENNVGYPVITGVTEMPFTYETICDIVKSFICGIHLSDAVLTANPNLKVSLELGLAETQEKMLDGTGFVTVGDTYDYTANELQGTVALTGADYYTTVDAAVAAALESGDFVKLVKDASLQGNLTLGKKFVLDLGGKTLAANEKSLLIDNSYVVMTNGTLSAFTKDNITLTGNAVLTVTDANVAASFRSDDTYYVSQNANGTYSIMLKSAFRVFITMVDGEPRIGFFKDRSDSTLTYTLLCATSLENADWASVAYTQSDDASGASELPLYWVKLDQAADDTNVYRFFKIGPAPVNEQID